MLAFKGVEAVAEDGPLTFGEVFTRPVFRNIVLSLLATLGLYILASLIFVSFFLVLIALLTDVWLFSLSHGI